MFQNHNNEEDPKRLSFQEESAQTSNTSTKKTTNPNAYTRYNASTRTRTRTRWSPGKKEKLVRALAPYRTSCMDFDDICKALTFNEPVSKESVKTQIFKLIKGKNEYSNGKYTEMLSDVENQYNAFRTPVENKKRRIDKTPASTATSRYDLLIQPDGISSSLHCNNNNNNDNNNYNNDDNYYYNYGYDDDGIDNGDDNEPYYGSYTPLRATDKDAIRHLRLDLGFNDIDLEGGSFYFPIPKCASSPYLFLEKHLTHADNSLVVSDIMKLPEQEDVMRAAKVISLDYYYICEVIYAEKTNGLCYSPTLEQVFLIKGSYKRFFQKYNRSQRNWNISKLVKVSYILKDTSIVTFMKDEDKDKVLSGLFTDMLVRNRIQAKKGSTGANTTYSNQNSTKSANMGTIDFSHRRGFTDLDFDIEVKSKKGNTAKSKVFKNAIPDKAVIFKQINHNKTAINNNNYKICKMNEKHLLLHYLNNPRQQPRVPFSTQISDSRILAALSDVGVQQQGPIISKLFEDTNWNFEPLREVSSTISHIALDIDYFSLDMILAPSVGVFNFKNDSPYESDKMSQVKIHVEKNILQHNQLESSLIIDKSRITRLPQILGHTFKEKTEANKKTYYLLPTSQNVVFKIKVHFCSVDESVNELDIIWHAICDVYKFLSKDNAGEGKATAFECSLQANESFRCSGGPLLSLMVLLLLSSRYSIEVILENYNGKVVVDCEGSVSDISIKEAYETNLRVLDTLSGLCITRFYTSIEEICQLNETEVNVKHLYAGFGCCLKTEKEGKQLFTCIRPIQCPFEFNINDLTYDEATLGSKTFRLPHQDKQKDKNHQYFPILGGCIDRNLQPHHVYPSSSSKYVDQTETFALENVVRVQSYSAPVRAFAIQSINKSSIINYSINKNSGIADFDRMSNNFKDWIAQLERNVASMKQDGAEGRIEITIDISENINSTNIHQTMIKKLDDVRAVVLSSYSSYDISSRLDILVHIAKAHYFKLYNYWTAFDRAPALHVDLFGDFWDIWHDISKFTATFWTGRFTSNKPFLPELQIYCSRVIFVPSGHLCNEHRDKLIDKTVYSTFLTKIRLDPLSMVQIPDNMIICPFKTKKHAMEYADVVKANDAEIACQHCRYMFLKTNMKAKKDLHPCIQTIDDKSYVKLGSETFWRSHNNLVESLDESQRKIYDASMEYPYLAVLGCPGTGKTFLTRLIIERLVLVKGSECVVPFSHNNDKADKIGGITFHHFLDFDITTDVLKLISDPKWVIKYAKDLHDRKRDKYDRILSAEYLIGDECSQISDELFQAGSQLLQYIRNEYSRPFGGVKIILAGDFSQISPISGKVLFKNKEFLKFFLVRHLESYHRTACIITIKTLDLLRVGNIESLSYINNNFGTNNSLGHSLFVLELILEKLFIDCTCKSNFLKYNCKNLYDNQRQVWFGDLVIVDKNGIVKLNLLAKMLMIERLESISADRMKTYYSNSEFFKSFPITICAENGEVDYLNENVITRGIHPCAVLHHVRMINRDGIEVVRSFYQEGNVFIVSDDKQTILTGTLTNVTDDYRTFTILLSIGKKTITMTGRDISRVFPFTYYTSQKITSQMNEDCEIETFTSRGRTVYLRRGQRF